MTKALLGIDTGGTFTDFVLLKDGELRVHKVLSNPRSPQTAILTGIEELGLMGEVKAGNVLVIHGTTVATNAALQGKGVRTAYITNKGLADVLKIGRQTRERLYDLTPPPRQQPFEDELLFEVDCRMNAAGEEIVALTDEALDALVAQVRGQKPKAIAINLLFSFQDPAHEIAIESRLQAAWSGSGAPDEVFVSRSSTILPEYREYERGMTTWVNAWIGPLIHTYLTGLGNALAPCMLAIMQSSGLTVASTLAATRAVNLLLSGPAGGLAGALFIGRSLGTTNLMTFDMGGTSSDVALLDGTIRLTGEGKIAGFPIGVPMADIHTIGAGGGSIAYVDPGGLLQVGPMSAGADPGPACYGNGGREPTVTDANLVLGRLRPDAFLGGRMILDKDAAVRAIEPLAAALGIPVVEVAFGIVRIANEHMVQALRVISIQRGYDPREFTLTCFGGAGGLHFCDLAEALEVPQAIVPVHSGVLSALGMLAAPPGRELVKTHRTLSSNISDAELGALFETLVGQGEAELAGEGVLAPDATRSLDLRYQGQTFTINVGYTGLASSMAAFHEAHKNQYGHDLDRPIEILNLRVHLEAPERSLNLPESGSRPASAPRTVDLEGIGHDVPLFERERLEPGFEFDGPALITEQHSTTLVKPGWHVSIDAVGNLSLVRP